jgi:hypothetical protein
MHRAASANRDHTQSKVWMTAWTMNSTIADTFGKLRFNNSETLPDSQTHSQTLPDSQTHSQTCIKWSHLDQRKNVLIRQVTSLNRFRSYDLFNDRTRKRRPFNTGDCLIEMTAWAGWTVYLGSMLTCIICVQQYWSLTSCIADTLGQ